MRAHSKAAHRPGCKRWSARIPAHWRRTGPRPGPGGANWTNTVTLRSTLEARSYEPGVWIGEIAPTPLMMVIASDDDIMMTDLEVDAYARAGQPKRLVMVPGGHFTPYSENLLVASLAATNWFLQHLKQPSGVPIPAGLTLTH
jgi:hypothetical protein